MKGFSLFVLLTFVLPMLAVGEPDAAYEQIAHLRSKRAALSTKMAKSNAALEAKLQAPYRVNDEVIALGTYSSLKEASEILSELETEERTMQQIESELDFYFNTPKEHLTARVASKEISMQQSLLNRFDTLVSEIVAARSNSIRGLEGLMELGKSDLDQKKAEHLRNVMIPFYEQKGRLLMDRLQTEILKADDTSALSFDLRSELFHFIQAQRAEILKRRNQITFHQRTGPDAQAYLETYAVVLNQFDNVEKKLKKLLPQ